MASWKIACLLFVFMINDPVYSQDGTNDNINLTLISNSQQKMAVCTDGSPGGYYYDPGFGDGASNWVVYLQGGGWCDSICKCQTNRNNVYGSTINNGPRLLEAILNSDQVSNPYFYNWNKAYVRYCDGGSFLGNTEADDLGPILQFRGSRIFSAIMEELVGKGMGDANNALLSGSSAGGLATMLHCDEFRAFLPNVGRVKCVADSGFFIRAKDLPYAYYREAVFANIIEIHNLTSFLPTSCTSRMNSSLCLFPEYFIGDIQTPLFLLNSGFDQYQIRNNLLPAPPNSEGWENCTNYAKPNECTPAQRQLIKDFRNAFLESLKEIGDNPSRGMLINACYIHVYLEYNYRWSSNIGLPGLQNKTISQAFGEWYFDRSRVQIIDAQTDFPINCF